MIVQKNIYENEKHNPFFMNQMKAYIKTLYKNKK